MYNQNHNQNILKKIVFILYNIIVVNAMYNVFMCLMYRVIVPESI